MNDFFDELNRKRREGNGSLVCFAGLIFLGLALAFGNLRQIAALSLIYGPLIICGARQYHEAKEEKSNVSGNRKAQAVPAQRAANRHRDSDS